MDWSYVAGYFDGEGSVRCKAAPSRPNYVLTSLSWSNTHEGSLQSIRDFIGCGYIQRRKQQGTQYTRGYQLNVNRALDVIRVGEAMLPYLIIKLDKVREVIAFVKANRKPMARNWGQLAKADPEEVRRLYWEEGLTQQQVAERFGVSGQAVTRYVQKHKIYARPSGPIPRRKNPASVWTAEAHHGRTT